MVHSIMRHVAETTGCNLEQLYGEVAWPLYKLYGHAYNAFAAMITDAEAEAVFQRLADEAHGGSPPPILSQAVRDGILVNIRWADSRGGSGGVGWLGGGVGRGRPGQAVAAGSGKPAVWRHAPQLGGAAASSCAAGPCPVPNSRPFNPTRAPLGRPALQAATDAAAHQGAG